MKAMINQEKYQAWQHRYPPAFELMERNFNSKPPLMVREKPFSNGAANNLPQDKMARKGIEMLVEANLKQNDKQAR